MCTMEFMPSVMIGLVHLCLWERKFNLNNVVFCLCQLNSGTMQHRHIKLLSVSVWFPCIRYTCGALRQSYHHNLRKTLYNHKYLWYIISCTLHYPSNTDSQPPTHPSHTHTHPHTPVPLYLLWRKWCGWLGWASTGHVTLFSIIITCVLGGWSKKTRGMWGTLGTDWARPHPISCVYLIRSAVKS